VPAAQQLHDLLPGDARGVLREKASLRHRVEAAEQRQPRIGDQGHDVALALDGPELEDQGGSQGVGSRDHARAGQLGRRGEGVDPEPDQIGHKEEEPTDVGGEASGRQDERARIGNRFRRWAGLLGAFFVEAAWQGCEAFGGEHLAHSGGAEVHVLFAERGADLVDGVVAFAQLDDALVGPGLLGLGARAAVGRGEKLGQRAAAELVAEDPEGAGAVAEQAGGLRGGALVDEVRA